jgi:hypothetical protein
MDSSICARGPLVFSDARAFAELGYQSMPETLTPELSLAVVVTPELCLQYGF